MPQIYHALGLHLHQPPGNLQWLSDIEPNTVALILQCYDRISHYALKYHDVARLHVSFSGTLLEQLQTPKIIDAFRDQLDIPAMLERYREADNIELLGMGYHHPLFALISPHDWGEQIQRGFDVIKDTFGRAPVGFYPPEMAFSMDLIPLLVKTGYQYAVVNAEFIQPHGGENDEFAAYKAYFEDSWISVVPIDRDFSQAQAKGLDPVWFAGESRRRVAHSLHPEQPRLLTSWSNGENGRWFRNADEGAGFFGHFFAPYMEHAEIAEFPTQPIAISEFLHVHPAQMSAHVESGAWHSGSSFGYGLSDWSSSTVQRERVDRLQQLSDRHAALALHSNTPEQWQALDAIYTHLLESQSSCFICWGEQWLEKLSPRLQAIEQDLAALEPSPVSPPPKTLATHTPHAEVTPDFAMDKIEALKIADAQAKAVVQADIEADTQARAKALAESKALAEAQLTNQVEKDEEQRAEGLAAAKAKAQAAIAQTLTGGGVAAQLTSNRKSGEKQAKLIVDVPAQLELEPEALIDISEVDEPPVKKPTRRRRKTTATAPSKPAEKSSDKIDTAAPPATVKQTSQTPRRQRKAPRKKTE